MLKVNNETNLKATLCSSSTTSKEEEMAQTLVLVHYITNILECRESD